MILYYITVQIGRIDEDINEAKISKGLPKSHKWFNQELAQRGREVFTDGVSDPPASHDMFQRNEELEQENGKLREQIEKLHQHHKELLCQNEELDKK